MNKRNEQKKQKASVFYIKQTYILLFALKNKNKGKKLKVEYNHFIRQKPSLSFTPKYKNIFPWSPPTSSKHTQTYT
jgi:hypothetical protein